MITPLLFATGIETVPTLNKGSRIGSDGEILHYDLAHSLRTGPGARAALSPLWPADPSHLARSDHDDWDSADETFTELLRLETIPIAGLCHFGVPDWFGTSWNSDFPGLFARYSRRFVRRFPRPDRRGSGTDSRALIDEWGEVHPTQGVCLSVPMVLPQDQEEPPAVRRRRRWIRRDHEPRKGRDPARQAQGVGC